jgi:hypothetical protein
MTSRPSSAEMLLLHEIWRRERERTDAGWLPSNEPDPKGRSERDIAKDRCLACGRLRGEGLRPDPVFGGERLDDPCIADLPGVGLACCGHGRHGRLDYVVGPGVPGELRGPAAARRMRELGGSPPARAFLLASIADGAM